MIFLPNSSCEHPPKFLACDNVQKMIVVLEYIICHCNVMQCFTNPNKFSTLDKWYNYLPHFGVHVSITVKGIVSMLVY